MAPPWEKPPVRQMSMYVKSAGNGMYGCTENDARRGDAFVYFGFDKGVQVLPGFEDALLIMGLV